MATITTVKEVYGQLASYEESISGSLVDPLVNPAMATDLLATLDSSAVQQDVLSRFGQNGTQAATYMQDSIDVSSAVTRELSIRAMLRSEYYEDAGAEHSDEMFRLDTKKLNTIQYINGNAESQRR